MYITAAPAARATVRTSSLDPCVLVLDVGSSSTRARIFDGRGDGVADLPAAQIRYAWRLSTDGAMEIDPEVVVDAAVGAIDGALAGARERRIKIAAVAVAALWHTLLGVDRNGAPITPVYAWGDTRAAPDARRLFEHVDAAALHRRTGCFVDPSYPSVKLHWLRRTRPELFQHAAGWMSLPEYVETRLLGRRRCTFSMAAGTGLLDIHRLGWDPEALACAAIDGSMLSPLVDAGETVRGLAGGFARRWPELREADWFPALGDGACANVGSGAVGLDAPGLTIGTSAAIRTVWAAERVEVPPGVWCYRLDARRWVAGRALSNGGNAVNFLREMLVLPRARAWESDIAAMEADAHGLTILPFLVGERGPGWSHERAATVVGVTAATSPERLLRAWLEAVALRLAAVASDLAEVAGPARHVWGSGGGLTASPAWSQIVADALGRTLRLPAETEATSRGAALMALERLGAIPSIAEAEPEIAAAFEPDPARHERYRAALARQNALAEVLRPWLEGTHPHPARADGTD